MRKVPKNRRPGAASARLLFAARPKRVLRLGTLLGMVLAASPPPFARPLAAQGGAGAEPAGKPAPAQVLLPPAGVYYAPKLLRLLARLEGLPVRVDNDRLNRVPVAVSPRLARRPVGIAELRVILLAHGIHVHHWEHPKLGTILVASRRADWKPPRPRWVKVFDVGMQSYARAYARVSALIAEANEKLPAGAPRAVVVGSERSGKLIVRAPSKAVIEAVARVLDKKGGPKAGGGASEEARGGERKDEGELVLLEYTARRIPAGELEARVRSALAEGERGRVRLAVAPTGNRLLIRTEKTLAEKVLRLLEAHDVKARP